MDIYLNEASDLTSPFWPDAPANLYILHNKTDVSVWQEFYFRLEEDRGMIIYNYTPVNPFGAIHFVKLLKCEVIVA